MSDNNTNNQDGKFSYRESKNKEIAPIPEREQKENTEKR